MHKSITHLSVNNYYHGFDHFPLFLKLKLHGLPRLINGNTTTTKKFTVNIRNCAMQIFNETISGFYWYYLDGKRMSKKCGKSRNTFLAWRFYSSPRPWRARVVQTCPAPLQGGEERQEVRGAVCKTAGGTDMIVLTGSVFFVPRRIELLEGLMMQ